MTRPLKIVRASDTPVYPISILEFMTIRSPRGDNITSLQAENALKTMALTPAVRPISRVSSRKSRRITSKSRKRLRTQYSLGFVPTNATKDGQFHKLKVALVDEQGNPLEIMNQKGKKVSTTLWRATAITPRSLNAKSAATPVSTMVMPCWLATAMTSLSRN